jgi:hypothetical protein
MKAILIDIKNQTITDVDIKGDLQSWYKLIGCQYVECAHYLNKHDSIMVDEEGLLSQPEGFFYVEGAHQPFAGNGLVVGVDKNGKTVDVKMTAADLIRIGVEFIHPMKIRLWLAAKEYREKLAI